MNRPDDSTEPIRDTVIPNPWAVLRRFTSARIGIGRTGVSQPTSRHLEFQLAHASARDAVYSTLRVPGMLQQLLSLGLDTIPVRSGATSRDVYLRRPDLGRRLDEESATRLSAYAAAGAGGYDAAFIVADGLSALAVERHVVPFLQVTLPRLSEAGWRLAPLTVVEQGRVAISDDIGAMLNARQAVILIGERPGLSSPDSLGIYLTYAPRIGATDADRNCISNVRDAGLSYAEAAHRLVFLMEAARARGFSGVQLKDESTPQHQVGSTTGHGSGNFLTDTDEASRRRAQKQGPG